MWIELINETETTEKNVENQEKKSHHSMMGLEYHPRSPRITQPHCRLKERLSPCVLMVNKKMHPSNGREGIALFYFLPTDITTSMCSWFLQPRYLYVSQCWLLPFNCWWSTFIHIQFHQVQHLFSNTEFLLLAGPFVRPYGSYRPP